MTNSITNFLLTQWLWSITGGYSHIFINIFLLFLLLKLWDHVKFTKALALSVFLNLGAFIVLFAFVGGILAWGFNISYSMPPDTYQGTYNPLNTSLILAAMYTVIQMLLFIGINHWMHINKWRTFLSIICSNGMSALLVYKLTFSL